MNSQRQLTFIGLTTLVAANVFAIWQFIDSGGVILEALWIYWLQSVIIGAVNVWRIMVIPLNSQGIFDSRGSEQKAPASFSARLFNSTFFALHYGSFHLVYAVFLFAFGTSGVRVEGFGNSPTTTDQLFTGTVSLHWVLLSGLLFALHHVLMFVFEWYELRHQTNKVASIQDIAKRPYARIWPMHMIIIFGPWLIVPFGNNAFFAAFMVLKTIADLTLFYKGTSHPSASRARHA